MDTKLPFLSAEVLGAAMAGALTFPVVLAGAQVAVFKPLGLTYTQGSRVSSLFGGLAVCAAGITASVATGQTLLNSLSTDNHSFGSISTTDVLLSGLSSVVVFRALGGRFGRVLPSHLLRPGAFANDWIPASRGMQYASDREREVIQTIGRKYGCHSCGRRRVSTFICDHQPPTKCVAQSDTMLSQRFYPHCNRCSQQQGGVLNGNGNGGLSPRVIRTHPYSIRPHHMFVPLPLLFAYLRGGRGTKEHIDDSVPSDVIKSESQETVDVGMQTTATKRTLHTLIHDSDIEELVTNFPLLIIWQKVVGFLDSFRNAGTSFHMTLWSFLIIAAWGTI